MLVKGPTEERHSSWMAAAFEWRGVKPLPYKVASKFVVGQCSMAHVQVLASGPSF